ncbi:MAG: DUF86 domain-containing protein [Thermoanaerobaculia bacterium]
MVDHEVFRSRLAKLEEYLARLEELARRARAEVLGNAGLMAQVERWMHLAVESAIDLAQHLISSRGWRTPTTNREAFRILREEKVLPSRLAEQMEDWAGLRNVLVHLYLEIDHQLLWTALTEELSQLRDFAAAVAKILDED